MYRPSFNRSSSAKYLVADAICIHLTETVGECGKRVVLSTILAVNANVYWFYSKKDQLTLGSTGSVLRLKSQCVCVCVCARAHTHTESLRRPNSASSGGKRCQYWQIKWTSALFYLTVIYSRKLMPLRMAVGPTFSLLSLYVSIHHTWQ